MKTDNYRPSRQARETKSCETKWADKKLNGKISNTQDADHYYEHDKFNRVTIKIG